MQQHPLEPYVARDDDGAGAPAAAVTLAQSRRNFIRSSTLGCQEWPAYFRDLNSGYACRSRIPERMAASTGRHHLSAHCSGNHNARDLVSACAGTSAAGQGKTPFGTSGRPSNYIAVRWRIRMMMIAPKIILRIAESRHAGWAYLVLIASLLGGTRSVAQVNSSQANHPSTESIASAMA